MSRSATLGKDTIIGLVITTPAGDSGVSLGQTDLRGLPQYLLDAISQFNSRPLGEILTPDE